MFLPYQLPPPFPFYAPPPPFIPFPPNNPCIFSPPPPPPPPAPPPAPPSPHSKSNPVLKKLSDRLASILGYVAAISIVGTAKSCYKRIKKLVKKKKKKNLKLTNII
jgi:hypothetical protein